MSVSKTAARLTAAAAAALLFTVFALLFDMGKPFIIGNIPEPGNTLSAFFSALCAGETKTCDRLIYGHSSIGFGDDADSQIGQTLLEAVRGSYSYDIIEPAAASGIEANATVNFTYLDASLLVDPVRTRSGELLTLRALSAASTNDIYDSDGSYREDVVMEVLSQALDEVLANGETYYVTVPLRVRLTYAQGHWSVILTDELVRAISGGLV